jgi:hypothetical protein
MLKQHAVKAHRDMEVKLHTFLDTNIRLISMVTAFRPRGKSTWYPFNRRLKDPVWNTTEHNDYYSE